MSSEKVIPGGQDPQEFRAKVLRAIEAEPEGTRRLATLKLKLKAVDEEIEKAAGSSQKRAPKKKG